MHWSKTVTSAAALVCHRASGPYVIMLAWRSRPINGACDPTPRDAGHSTMQMAPRSEATEMTRVPLPTSLFALSTSLAMRPCASWIPSGLSTSRTIGGPPGSNRAADQVEQGNDAMTPTHLGLAAKEHNWSATWFEVRSRALLPSTVSTIKHPIPDLPKCDARSPSRRGPLHR